LSQDPLLWTDEQLTFLDDVSDQDIIGLGEATHGTSEFFNAKHRMLRYMVEHHGYKIFTIEADFGESMFINEAVLNSDKSQIETLMKTKMHFWTWRTTEVRDLLYWMCDYNVGKADSEKVQYWGIDCQFNTYHADLLLDYLVDVNVGFVDFAESVLTEAKTASGERFSGYSATEFVTYLGKVDALNDSLLKYQADIEAVSSENSYRLHLQLLAVVRQASEVRYSSQGAGKRDEYMALNTQWLFNYMGNAKIVLWAHNYHVSDFASGGAMGYFLKDFLPGKYYVLGFLFSKGNFTAVTYNNGQSQGLHLQTIDAEPKDGSLNALFSHAATDVFTVAISDLQKHSEWPAAFTGGLEYFHLGAVFNNKPMEYYTPFSAAYYDRLIYFDRTQAAAQLPN
jgi:erythromycin esterase